ncbi:hypothetical protein PR202_gb21213 [Eleusine coracana subsp. coracana]|uniref:Uncharacterized protein n=1 Tax=Eleusine coracana subsp. coracana TaxID=191504 RepID=A0AAV5FCI8_ELECO|nr:hypothetical protein PR202_gb21213 [Eleusine coracana subsp. coracana]
MDTKQHLVVARLSHASKVVEQVFRDQRIMAKKLEEMEQAVARFSSSRMSASQLHLASTVTDQMCGGCCPPVLPEGTALPVFDEMPLKIEIVAKSEQMEFQAPVLWDDELQHNKDSHDGLLKQLAGCVEYSVDDQFHSDAASDVFDDISLEHEVAEESKQVVFTSSVVWDKEAEGLLNEMPHKNVIWDEEISYDCDTHGEWLQLPAMGAEHYVEKTSSDVMWEMDISHDCDLCHGLLEQLAQGEELIVDRNSHNVYDEIPYNVEWDEVPTPGHDMHRGLLQEIVVGKGYPDVKNFIHAVGSSLYLVLVGDVIEHVNVKSLELRLVNDDQIADDIMLSEADDNLHRQELHSCSVKVLSYIKSYLNKDIITFEGRKVADGIWKVFVEVPPSRQPTFRALSDEMADAKRAELYMSSQPTAQTREQLYIAEVKHRGINPENQKQKLGFIPFGCLPRGGSIPAAVRPLRSAATPCSRAHVPVVARRWPRAVTVLLASVPEGRGVRPCDFNPRALVREFAACDPLHHRYIMLPTIPEDLTALVNQPEIMRFSPFLAPSDEDEGGTSFRVICLVQCQTNLVLFIFSSISGSWHAVEFDVWRALTAESSNPAPGFLPDLDRPDYAHGCFCWVMDWSHQLLVLDMGTMEFCS